MSPKNSYFVKVGKTMKLLRNLLLLALILVLVYIGLEIIISNVFPFIFWIFKVIVSLALLIAIGAAVIFLYKKLRS